jgi:hypothetical protein
MRRPTDEIGTSLASIRTEGFSEDLEGAPAGDEDGEEFVRFAK